MFLCPHRSQNDSLSVQPANAHRNVHYRTPTALSPEVWSLSGVSEPELCRYRAYKKGQTQLPQQELIVAPLRSWLTDLQQTSLEHNTTRTNKNVMQNTTSQVSCEMNLYATNLLYRLSFGNKMLVSCKLSNFHGISRGRKLHCGEKIRRFNVCTVSLESNPVAMQSRLPCVFPLYHSVGKQQRLHLCCMFTVKKPTSDS